MNNAFDQEAVNQYNLQTLRNIGDLSQPRNRFASQGVSLNNANPSPPENQPLLPNLRSSAGSNNDARMVYEGTSPVFVPLYRTHSGGPCSLGRTGGSCSNSGCRYCGYSHPGAYLRKGGGDADSGREVREKANCPPGDGKDSGGEGDGKDSGGGGNGKDSSGGGDGGSDKKKDDVKDKGSGGGGDGGGGGPPYFNADDPNVCPDWATDAIFYFLALSVFSCFIGVFLCRGSPNMKECMMNGGRSRSPCKMNPNLLKHLNKTSCRGGKGKSQTTTADIPNHLKEQYDHFRNALANTECLYRFKEKCPGLINYAGTMAGGSIVTTRDTKAFHNPMLCRCHDAGSPGKLCDPSDAVECTDCRCEEMQADTLIKEDDKLVAGRCWAFSGVGRVLIHLFYPIIVTGVSLHHPQKTQILPGYYNSAPREFEVWGYNMTEDPDPFMFGKYEYLSDTSPSQIFEVQNFTLQPYDHIQFNFLSNYGNKNYTAVYKVEVHGLLDTTLMGPD